MKRNVFARLLAIVCVLLITVSVCGCAPKSFSKAMSLEGGWYSIDDATDISDKVLAKGFKDKEDALLISELSQNTGCVSCYSNTFSSRLDVNSTDNVVLDIYDAKGNVTIWLNGKEIAAQEMSAGRSSFDITKAIKNSGKNTLVIKTEPVEGKVSLGSRIDINVHSSVGIYDVYTVSDTENAVMKVYAVINNTTDKEISIPVSASLASVDNNAVAANVTKTITVPAGYSTHELEFNGENLIAWSNENPFIYMLRVETPEESYFDYVGYKSFTVDENGVFNINGKPILIKAAAISENETSSKNLYEILNYIKTAGFNTVSVGDGVASERLLEYCDRLGLLVYEGEATVAVAQRDRGHVSLSLAKGNIADWKEAGANVVVIDAEGASNVNAEGIDVKLNVVEYAPKNSADKQFIEAISKAEGPLFINSVGVSGVIENVVDAQLINDWYLGFDVDKIMALGEITDVVNGINTKENSIVLDYVRAKNISGFCFTTDISRFKSDLTEVINDDINDLRFTILTDKSNAFNTDTLNLNISLANFNVLEKGSFETLIKITGEDGPVYEKRVDVTIKDGNSVISILSENINLSSYAEGEYVISAEFTDGAHPVCNEKTILIHSETSLPKLSGMVYTLGVNNKVAELFTKQGATVKEFSGSESGVIVIGENCTDAALIEKAYSVGKKVIVLGAQNKEILPVEGEFATLEYNALLHKTAFTENMVRSSCIFEAGVFGPILGENFFVADGYEEAAVSAYNVLADGSVEAGIMFANYENKYIVSTMEIEENITNPYAALLLLNAVK